MYPLSVLCSLVQIGFLPDSMSFYSCAMNLEFGPANLQGILFTTIGRAN